MGKTKIVKKINYQCNYCGKRNVKLWKPYSETEPLICAECAENNQRRFKYVIRDAKKIAQCKAVLPRWTVNEKGQVPSYSGNIPKVNSGMTDNLIIIIEGKIYNMFPAVINDNNGFYKYHSIPKELYKKWEKLPTR